MTLSEMLRFLNEINALDPTVLPALIAHRVPCNEKLRDHPTVQVGEREGGGYEVGLLGFLNGIYGHDSDGWGYIAANFQPDGSISEFMQTPATRKH